MCAGTSGANREVIGSRPGPGTPSTKEHTVNLTTHPLAVAAELAWKQENLSRAGVLSIRPRKQCRRGWHLPKLPGPRVPAATPRHTPRPA